MNHLSSERKLLMTSIRDEWIKVAFDTSSVNKEKAEAAINLTYESMDGNKPAEIIWFDNPLDAVIWMMNNLQNLQSPKHFSAVSHQIAWEDELIYPINRNVPTTITEQFEINFNRVIHRKYLFWLSNSFLANFLNCHLRFHLCHIWEEESYLAKQRDYYDIETVEVIGMHDIYYLAIGYDRSKFRGYWEAAKYCGLWWAFADVAVVIPKPSGINLDSKYRLHGERKPAIIYSGFESYAHHGKYVENL